MKTIKQLMEQRAECVVKAQAIQDKAQKEKRDPTPEERTQFDAFMDEGDKHKEQADILQGDLDRRAKLETAKAELEESRGRQTNTELGEKANKAGDAEKRTIVLRKNRMGTDRSITVNVAESDLQLQAFRHYLCDGKRSLEDKEIRALQKDSGAAGGFLSAPIEFMAQLIQELDNIVFMRQICNVLPPLKTADSLGVPSLDNDPADPIWTAEIGTGDEDSDMSFGNRQLSPHPLAKRLKVSDTLIRRSEIPADDIVRERLAFKMGATQENAFLNGDGALKPLGVFTASDNGITTSQDISDGNTSTQIRFDGLINALYALPKQYRNLALNWIFHRDAVKQIRKLKDGDGQYIWERSVRAGEPDTILNFPIKESEYAPNTFTANLYVGVLGDFSKYWIVDALTMVIKVLEELYAETNQIGYISRSETDGMPVLASAFRRVKLGA